MSILGYSASYFLPQYWANTPLYGEKIIPLLDYILSTDYQYTDKLASAFYDIESKYKNTSDLPIDKIEAIIEENGYKYIRDLLGQDEDSLRLLVYILVLINELKGSKKGIETVLSLLRTKEDDMQLYVIGSPQISPNKEVSGFTNSNYISYSNFSVGNNPFELIFQIKTGSLFTSDECIASSPEFGFYLGINSDGRIVLKVGKSVEGVRVWQSLGDDTSTKFLAPSTNYYIKFYFNGSFYGVSVSTDGITYSNFIDLESSVGLSITRGALLIGIDGSGTEKKYPFKGSIALAPLNVSASNVVITQWYELFPVGEENTYSIEADVDVNLVSSNFFIQFAKFAERYVYPSLAAFRAKMALKAQITFLPYTRQKITYVATNISDAEFETFNVLKEGSAISREVYNVVKPKLYAWTYDGEYVYTTSEEIYPATKLYNKDMSEYKGSNFRIRQISNEQYRICYGNIVTNRDAMSDIYSGTPFLTIRDSD